MIRGGAMSRILFFFPLRVYYEAAAAIDLRASHPPGGSLGFSYAGLPETAYVMRTLGFSGKTMALLTVAEEADAPGAEVFEAELLKRWQVQAPEFADRVKNVKKFSHLLRKTGGQPFAFTRDADGYFRGITVMLEPRYRHYPARTGIYFKVFPMLAELLKLLNHPFLPDRGKMGDLAALPAEWQGEDLNFSADLTRVAGLIEEAVKSLVTVKQGFAFRMRFRVASRSADLIEIRGEARPNAPIWKSFMIREVRRRVCLRPDTREVLVDEFFMDVRNKKGQGGFGRLQLKKTDPREVDR
jgi:hypothetical protein